MDDVDDVSHILERLLILLAGDSNDSCSVALSNLSFKILCCILYVDLQCKYINQSGRANVQYSMKKCIL